MSKEQHLLNALVGQRDQALNHNAELMAQVAVLQEQNAALTAAADAPDDEGKKAAEKVRNQKAGKK